MISNGFPASMAMAARVRIIVSLFDLVGLWPRFSLGAILFVGWIEKRGRCPLLAKANSPLEYFYKAEIIFSCGIVYGMRYRCRQYCPCRREFHQGMRHLCLRA